MQVLLVGQTPPPYNGMASATVPLLELSGVRVSLLDLGDARPLATSGRWSISNVVDASRATFQLLKHRPWRSDLAHVPIAQNTPGVLRDALLLLVLRMSRVPFVVHLNGGYFDQWYRGASAPMRWVARATIGHAARGLVLSSGLVHCLECVLPPSRISVCENGTAPQGEPRLPTRAHSLSVLHIGALTPEKGTLELIRAVDSLQDVRLVLAGEPWPEVQAAVGRSETITLTGPVAGAAKATLFAQADVVCLPTRYPFEGQPLALLEAMSVGLPVVTTRRAAIEDSVGDAGLYVPEGDVAAIAEALSTLRDDPDLRAELGARGRVRYEERFTAEAYQDRIVATWHEVATERGP
jgi:glycosyltransferase involved in cell wall biosynthesis